MKFLRFIVVLFTAFSTVNTNAQQRPHYTQYIMNNFIINPAVAGIENYWDAKLSHRAQWVGLQDAPVTTYFTIHGPLKKSAYGRETATTFHARGDNPRGQAYWQEYQKAEPHMGFGATFISDQTGPLKRTAANVALSYHIGISEQTSLSGGLSFGFNQMTLDADKLQFANPLDPVVASSGLLDRFTPDISAGLWLYSRDYFVGAAIQQAIPQRLYFSDGIVGWDQAKKLVPHIFVTAGTRLFLSEDWAVLPSAMLRFVQPLPMGFDLNMKFQYQDYFWFGGGYRYQDGFSGMFGLNISNTFNLGYSYDFTTSQLNTVSRGSHEILLGFLIGNRYGDWCPRNNW